MFGYNRLYVTCYCSSIKYIFFFRNAIFLFFYLLYLFFFKNMLAKTVEINWHDGQAIYSVDFSPDGSRYATAGADNSVRVM